MGDKIYRAVNREGMVELSYDHADGQTTIEMFAPEDAEGLARQLTSAAHSARERVETRNLQIAREIEEADVLVKKLAEKRVRIKALETAVNGGSPGSE